MHEYCISTQMLGAAKKSFAVCSKKDIKRLKECNFKYFFQCIHVENLLNCVLDKEMFENCAEGLVRKSGAMFEKFRLLLMKESMVSMCCQEILKPKYERIIQFFPFYAVDSDFKYMVANASSCLYQMHVVNFLMHSEFLSN
jgi:hypothetical protein